MGMTSQIFDSQFELLEAMLDMDNAVENSGLTVSELKNYFENSNNVMDLDLSKNNLFITDGDPFITINIIKSLEGSLKHNVLFVNRSFCAVNKWLVKNIAQRNDIDLEIDTNYNYNDYIGSKYNIVPVGEKSLIDQVRSDFDYDE